jgi:hypothetical protein
MGRPAPNSPRFVRNWIRRLVRRNAKTDPGMRAWWIRTARKDIRTLKDGNEVARLVIILNEAGGQVPRRWPRNTPPPTWPTLRVEMQRLGVSLPA